MGSLMVCRVLKVLLLAMFVGLVGCGHRIWAQEALPGASSMRDGAALAQVEREITPKVVPGAVWRDMNGKVIEAHGGGVTKLGEYWYWFGEDRSPSLPKGTKAVHVYRSSDLVQWEDRGRALTATEPKEWIEKYGTDWQLERPKVFVTQTSGARFQYVMYVHLDAAYKAAEVGVAGSNSIEGPYTLISHFRPLGQESRDIGQFVDDDGTNYLMFESRPTGGFFIAKLSPDALSVVDQTAFVHSPLEGNAMAHVGDTYYCVGSHMTGWAANPDVYATSKALAGPWSSFENLAPPETNTYGGQSAALLKVTGSDGREQVIFIGDVWKPKDLADSRYLWIPMEIDDGKMTLPAPAPWRIDVKTAIVSPAR